MHFFIENSKLTEQGLTDSFGIDDSNLNLFKITTEFLLTDIAKAFTCQKGMMIVQPSNVDAGLVNIILKPTTGLKIAFSVVKYYIYRGISRNTLFINNKIIPKSQVPENHFLQRIWKETEDFRKTFNLPDHPDPTPKDFGYDNDLPNTLKIEKLFDNSQSETFPIYVKEGEWIGDFGNSKKIGFEIILETDNLENPSFDNQINLEYIRKQNHTIDVSALSSFEKRAKQELVLSYIDPCAFFGFHYDVGVNVSVFSGNTKSVVKKKQTELYNELLNKFYNKNKIYLDIRSENGYSYNFYQNYKDANNKNVKIENSTSEYETDSWPILILDSPNKDKININLRIDDNLKPILFSENRELFEIHNNSCFLDDTKLLNESSTNWTKNIALNFPIVGTKNVAYYAKLYYFRQEHNPFYRNKTLKSKSISSYTVPSGIFASLDTPNLGDSDYIFQQTLNPNYTFLKGNLPNGEDFSGVVIAGANFDENRIIFHTQMVFPNETTGDFYSDTEPGIGKGFNLEGNFNQMSFLKRDLFCFSQNIQESENEEPVKVLDILAYKSYPSGKENLFLLGLTQSELSELKKVTGLSNKHSRYIGFEDASPDSETDINGKSFGKYKLNVQGLDDNGEVAVVYPISDIVVYSFGGFVFGSKDFADAEQETRIVFSNLNLSSGESAFIDDPKNIGIKAYFENYLFENHTLRDFEYVKWLIRFLLENKEASNYFSEYPQDIDTLSLQYFNTQNISESEIAKIISMIYALFLRGIKEGVDGLKNNPAWKILWKACKETIIYALRYETILLVKVMNWFMRTFESNLSPVELGIINNNLANIKVAIDELGLINYNPQKMQWRDIIACWLFEMGDFPINSSADFGNLPTIGFVGDAYVISGMPNNDMRYLRAHRKLANGNVDAKSVMGVRNEVIKRIKQGKLEPYGDEWGFGFPEIKDTYIKKDGLQYCLGSYNTTVFITPLGSNKYELTFIIKNKTGRESGTRWLNDGDGNPHNDSVLQDKLRGVGIHLGGTIAETFGWKETHTIIP